MRGGDPYGRSDGYGRGGSGAAERGRDGNYRQYRDAPARDRGTAARGSSGQADPRDYGSPAEAYDYGRADRAQDGGRSAAPAPAGRSGRRAGRSQPAPSRRGTDARSRLAARLGGPAAASTAGYPSGPAAAGDYPGEDSRRAPDGRGSGPDRAGNGRGGPGRNGSGRNDPGRGGSGPGGPGGPGGRRPGGRGRGGAAFRPPRGKGDWWRRWTWKKAILTALATSGGFGVLLVILAGLAYAETPIPAASSFAIGQASRVYFQNGTTLVGMFGSTDRQVLTANQIPAMVQNAMVAAEDKHFYNEGGVSPTGIIRAAIADLTSGSVQQGGSTITQELVRNYYLGIGTQQTASRKIKEIFVAEKLAQEKSKEWILTQYMNVVPTGADIYGFGAAAQQYFGVPVSQLTVAQAAMIAAMPQSPSYYNPDPKAGAAYQALVYRWHYVLNTMVQMGTLSQKEASEQKFPTLAPAFDNNWSGYRGYIMDAVMNELENTYHYTRSQIDNGGLHIVTTFSQPLMNQLYQTVAQQVQQMKADGKPLPSYAHIGAVLEQPSTGAIVAMYSGADYAQSQWDMALQNREQVGSSFKPYVLALARSQGMSVKTSTLNGYSPLWIPPVSDPTTFASRSQPADSASWYEVGNDSGDGSMGPVSVVTASAVSLNTAYTDLYHRVAGTDGQNIVQMAQAFGVNTAASGLDTMRDEVGTALGQASLTVGEQASTFSTFANNGEYIAPHVIAQIISGVNTIAAHPVKREVLTPDEASDVDYALSFDTKTGGTAAGEGMTDGREIVAKTGTTNLSQSAFFIGSIPQYTLAVGMFTNQQGCPDTIAGCTAAANEETAPPPGIETLYGVGGLQGYGGQWPAYIWHSFAEKEWASLPIESFPTPDFGGTAWNLLPPGLTKPKPSSSLSSSSGAGFAQKCQSLGGQVGSDGNCYDQNGQQLNPPGTNEGGQNGQNQGGQNQQGTGGGGLFGNNAGNSTPNTASGGATQATAAVRMRRISTG